MIARWFCIVIVALSAVAARAAEPVPPTRLFPVDEAARDPSFVAFRDELKAVIARKDAAKLFTYLASDIKLDFGGGYGGPEFHKRWKPFDKDTKVWKALSLVVDNGGKFPVSGGFAAPYVFAAFPEGLDAFEVLIATNKDAVMRTAPRPDAAIVRKLDHDILTIVKSAHRLQHEAGPTDWSEVKDANGKHGFVLDQDLRSPIDYRAIFERRDGKWVMQTFIAGD